jgi:hypothetical protein
VGAYGFCDGNRYDAGEGESFCRQRREVEDEDVFDFFFFHECDSVCCRVGLVLEDEGEGD